ncbi:hypothetical protein HN873_049529 [Arachis hypogaea]
MSECCSTCTTLPVFCTASNSFSVSPNSISLLSLLGCRSGPSLWESLFGKGIIPGPPLTTPSSSPMSIFHYIHFDCCFCFFNCRFVFLVSFRMRSRGTAWSSLLGLPLPPLPLLGLVSSFLRYSLRHFHDEKVEQRLESIEKVMKHKHNLEHSEIKDIVGPGGLSVPTCAATAATTLFIGIVPSF